MDRPTDRWVSWTVFSNVVADRRAGAGDKGIGRKTKHCRKPVSPDESPFGYDLFLSFQGNRSVSEHLTLFLPHFL